MTLPFGSKQVAFCQALSEVIFDDEVCKEYPDFFVLAFWLREANVRKMEQEWKVKGEGRVAIGKVFHIPPRNVEVMAFYSWIVSLLMGNSNIIRISDKASFEFDHLMTLVTAVLNREEFIPLRDTTMFVQYGHDDAITKQLSELADVRIVWGGDDAVAKVSSIPMKVNGKQIAFPDRFSFAAVDGNAFAQCDEKEKRNIIKDFFNDVYWFDQAGCSSPRLVFWYGKTSDHFYPYLQEEIEKKRYKISTGGSLSKLTYAYTMALRLPVEKVERLSNELLIMRITQAEDGVREHCGQGLLYHLPITKLEEIASFVTQKDQSLIYYGLTDLQIETIKRAINGKGITRYVPFGQALTFDPVWDGHDLTLELTKKDIKNG